MITGTIEQEGVTASFVCDDHKFVFLPSERDLNVFNQGVLKQENGFIKGTTHQGNGILIYTRDDIELRPTYTLTTWIYIVFTGSCINECSSMRLNAGVLNSLFAQRSLKINGFGKKEKQYYEVCNDTIKYPIDEDNVDYITIRSGVKQKWSSREGGAIKNDGVYLELVFKDPQSIDGVFKKYYQNIVALCQFMTFRKDISFEKIELTQYRENEKYERYIKIADCYIKPDYQAENDRDPHRCITFDALGKNTSNLYRLVNRRNAKHSEFCVDFIPESKKDSYWMTGKKIRDICTSIEVEAGINRITVENSEAFRNAIAAIKDIIKEKKESLTDKEFNYIKGNIDHLNGPAAELAKGLYDRFKQEVEPLVKTFQLDDLSIEDINGLIKIRNTLTHGGGIAFGDREASTAVLMMGVVYASILKRCGCNTEQIAELFEKGVLTSRF